MSVRSMCIFSGMFESSNLLSIRLMVHALGMYHGCLFNQYLISCFTKSGKCLNLK